MNKKQEGSNSREMRQHNQMLLLKLIATGAAASRVELARAAGLSKMTVGSLVSELIAREIIVETGPEEAALTGRPPILLSLSGHSPVICGMLIKRGLCQVILGDLSGAVLSRRTCRYESEGMSEAHLVSSLLAAYEELHSRCPRRIAAIGISSLGPLNSVTGEILNPPDFYGISNLKIVEAIREKTGLPAYLINDANAGALAEKLYGRGKAYDSFLYLHIMNGIGAGLVLNHKLYEGGSGQSGEIGHTSISFCGPKCSCGNTGCLDLYANLEAMKRRASELSPLYPASPLTNRRGTEWTDFVDCGNRKDPLALAVLGEFCGYVGYALANALNLLDISRVIVGYDSHTLGGCVEELLSCRVSSSVLCSKYRPLSILHSHFSGDAPLVGSLAVVADRIFRCELELPFDN